MNCSLKLLQKNSFRTCTSCSTVVSLINQSAWRFRRNCNTSSSNATASTGNSRKKVDDTLTEAQKKDAEMRKQRILENKKHTVLIDASPVCNNTIPTLVMEFTSYNRCSGEHTINYHISLLEHPLDMLKCC
jgi:hypothetical protein